MAYRGSPEDLFASENSDSDATVDLSVPSGSEARQRDSESMASTKQNKIQRSLQRQSRHAISSSDSEDDNRHTGNSGPSSSVNECLLGHMSEDSVRANSNAGACSDETRAVADADKRVLCLQQPLTDLLDDRPLCKYGEKCYRRNPSHFQEFRHPGNYFTA